MAIQMRRGNYADYDETKIKPGEWAVALDTEQVFVGVGSGDAIEMASKDYADQVQNNAVVAIQNAKVSSLATIYGGNPTTASTVAQMTDTSKTYVYTGSETGYVNGNWYYYDVTTSTWTSGGSYDVDIDNALSTSSTNAVQNKVVATEISDLKSDLTAIENNVGTLSNLTTETQTDLVSAVNELDSCKAENDGYYEEMTVGDAEQLVSTKYVEDKVPYLFRTTGGSADVGNRAYIDAIVGGTLAWNQLVRISQVDASKTQNGVTITDNRDGTYTVSTDANGATAYTYSALSNANVTFKGGHKYLFCGTPSTGSVNTYYSYMVGLVTLYDYGKGLIFAVPTDGSVTIVVAYIKQGTVITTPVTFKPQIFDLTQMFGTTIADYIYTLESGTAGAGIAKLKEWGFFTEPYYPYNAGELKSVEGLSSHEMVGFNQWDEEWEVGGLYNATGLPWNTSDRIRSKNFIPVGAGMLYYANIPLNACCWYDANYNFISGTSAYYTILYSPQNAAFLKFATQAAYGTTYNHDICINLSWSGYRNGEYEAYEKHSYALDSDLTLRGIPKLDASNNLYYDGDTYENDGTVTRRFETITLNGSETWSKESSQNDVSGNPISRFYMANNAIKKPDGNASTRNYIGHMLSTIPTVKGGYVNQYSMNGIDVAVTGYQGEIGNYLYIIVNNAINSTLTSVDALKAWLVNSPLTVLYELATPTAETADAYQQIQICNDFGTEEFVSTGIVPVGHETRYPANLRDKLQHLPDLANSDGTYLVSQSNEQMSLTPYSAPTGLPDAPTTDGTYTLIATVSGGAVTYSWEATS